MDPAHLSALVSRVEEWATLPANTDMARQRSGESWGEGWWGPSAEAVKWLLEFESDIEKRPELCSKYALVRAPLHDMLFFRTVMPSASGRELLSEIQVNHFKLLADALVRDTERAERVIATMPELGALRDNLNSLRGDITASDLGQDVSEYLLRLIDGFDEALGEVAVRGVADVQRLADELAGALLRLFVPSPDSEEAQGRYQKVKVLVSKGYAFFNSQLVAAVVGAVAIKAIGA